jgi:ribosomal silencing factor RsfS
MNTIEKLKQIYSIMDDKKAEDIKILELKNLSSLRYTLAPIASKGSFILFIGRLLRDESPV